MTRKKAYIINGGAGRVICSIPAFEKLNETDKDFIIVCEGGTEMYHGHPTLGARVFDFRHKNLFNDYLKDRDILRQNRIVYGNIITKNVVLLRRLILKLIIKESETYPLQR